MERKALPAKEIQRPVEFRAAVPYEEHYIPVEVKGNLEDVIAVAVVAIGTYFFFKWLFSE